MSKNLLLSCAGRRVELLRIWERTFRDIGMDAKVIASDAQPFAPAFALAERQVIVPRVLKPEFVPRMLEICAANDVRWVIPTIDTELPVLARARAEFEAVGVNVMVSDIETIDIASDKRRTHEWFVKQGFPTFEQRSPEAALADPDWRYPCFAKPADGSRSVGAARIETREDLENRVKSGLHPNDVVESLGHGVEVTVDAYVSIKSGKCLCVVPRRRLEVRDGEVSKGKTIDAPEIVDLVRRVAEALPGARGTICVQMFWDPETRDIQLMEINPRFGGGYPLTDAAGAKFARWFIEEDCGLPVTAHEHWTRDLVMLRYDQSLFLRG